MLRASHEPGGGKTAVLQEVHVNGGRALNFTEIKSALNEHRTRSSPD